MSITRSSWGREQQINTFSAAGGSSGSGSYFTDPEINPHSQVWHQGDSDRKAGRREARTSGRKREPRAAGEASARPWGHLLCKRWRAHLSVSCDKKSGVPRDVPFLGLGPAVEMMQASQKPPIPCERPASIGSNGTT